MVKVHLNNLAVIVGTACNLKCKHCLGGNPNKHMVIQEKYINDLTPNITGIDELSFIGYEDTLYIEEMKMIFDKLLSAGIKINRFTAFTNAVDYSQDLIDKMVLLIKEELHHFYQVLLRVVCLRLLRAILYILIYIVCWRSCQAHRLPILRHRLRNPLRMLINTIISRIPETVKSIRC